MSNVLKVNWSFGFSKDITNGVHSLSHSGRNCIFFLASHSGVIYDFEHRTQMILQGHCNIIRCCAVSSDKRWVVTADTGDDSIMVVWDSFTGAPVKTFFSPHSRGVAALDISNDGNHIACPTSDLQTVVKFDPAVSSEIVTTGGKTALTTTANGSAILWESQFASVLMETPSEKQLRTASKVIRLVESSINFVTTLSSGYVAVGCDDGTVKFYDFSLRLEAWFEDLAAGPVNSISFATQECPFRADQAGSPGLQFWVPDFMVGTTDAFIVGAAIFDEVRPEDRRGTLLMQGMTEYVSHCACHPSRSLVALASHNGSLQIWDYETKLLMNLREFNNRDIISTAKANSAAARLEARNYLRPQCIAFEPNGEFIAVGFTSGHVKFLSVETFEDIASFAPSIDAVYGLQFSKSGIYMSCYDSSNHVLLFKKSSHIDPATLGDEAAQDNGYFFYLGRILAHDGAVTGLEFTTRDGQESLISIGEDRRCVEYDIDASTVISGVQVIDAVPVQLDVVAKPTAVVSVPPS
eukprot:GSChrysophyteH1.ASY1.ANO1.479.1 assembled CDS